MMFFVIMITLALVALGIIYFKDVMLHKKRKELARSFSTEGARKNKERLDKIEKSGGARLNVSITSEDRNNNDWNQLS